MGLPNLDHNALHGEGRMKGWKTVNEIKVLLQKGMKIAAIARRLGIDRKTVRKYRDLDMDEIAAYRGQSVTRTQRLDPYQKVIEERVNAMAAEGVINAQAIYHELVDLGYVGSSRSVRRAVASSRKKVVRRRIYQPFETKPGAQAMVDLGEKRKVWINGEKRTVHFVVMVLGYSRMKYAEFFDRPIDTEAFIQFHQRAFSFFEGVPGEVVYDQTKLAVLSEVYGEAAFNEQFYRYANWEGFKMYICKARDPETKGKVEAAIRYIKGSFLVGRQFENWTELHRQGERWLEKVANQKVHEITGQIPQEAWQQERPCLRAKTNRTYKAKPAFRQQQVYKDGLVKVLGNRYSVPGSHHDQEVKVRVTETWVEIYSLVEEPLFRHVRYHGKGKRFLEKEHYQRKPRVDKEVLIQKMTALYGEPELIKRLEHQFPRHYREQCHGLISLGKRYEPGLLRRAAKRLLHHDCVSYRNMVRVLEFLNTANSESEPFAPTVQVQMPLDLGLEERPPTYYDVVEVTHEC